MRLVPALCFLASAALGFAACQRGRPRATALAPAPAASAALQKDQSRRAEARALVRSEISRSFAMPAHLDERRCPDAELEALAPDQRELPLAVSDSRYEGRSVLPLAVTRQLVDPDPSRLESALVGIDHPESPDSAIDAIQWLSSRRYVAVFHVIDFAKPRRFHRVGHRHAEWYGGRILALLVVHDAQSGKAMCQTRLTVFGDAHGAPLAVRLRSTTRDELTDKLGKSLRRAARPALARLSSVLYLRGDGAGHRVLTARR